METAWTPCAPAHVSRGSSGAQVLTVMYHYVRDQESLPRPGSPGPFGGISSLSSRDFQTQLDQLTAAMEPIEWPRLAAFLSGREGLPRRCFLLTFDDGLADHVETVVPILESRGLRGAFFVPGAVLAGNRMLSAHSVHLLLSALGDDGLATELLRELERRDQEGLWAGQFRETTGECRRSITSIYSYETPLRARLKHFLHMELPIPLRIAAIDALFERHIGSSARWSRHWYLGWHDLVRMQSAGHTIGGHGFLHEPYGRMTPIAIRRDVIRSGLILREGLGPDRRPFSYPFGSTSGPVYEACREAGFVHAFTTREDWVRSEDDCLQLPRFDTIHVGLQLQAELGSRP